MKVINGKDIQLSLSNDAVVYIIKKLFTGAIKMEFETEYSYECGVNITNITLKDCDKNYIKVYIDVIDTIILNYRTYKSVLKNGFFRDHIEYVELSDDEYKEMLKSIVLKCHQIIDEDPDVLDLEKKHMTIIDDVFKDFNL